MKLEKFKEEKNKKKSIIIFTISCVLLIVGVFFYQSFALFETRENFNFIEGQVQDPGDLYFAYYVDDVLTYEMPSKDSGLTLSNKSSCTNGVTISWDDEAWTAIVNYSAYEKENNSRVKCTLYFEEKPTLVDPKDYILAKANEGEIIEDDGTTDHNMRYIGANPANYIDIGDRDADGNVILWRIIGSFNNIKSSESAEIGETRLKIVRNGKIGSFPWDISASGVNAGNGVNEWSQSGLNILLNDYYYNNVKKENNCYANSTTISCDFTSIGLGEKAKTMIGGALWNTAAVYSLDDAAASYSNERGSLTGLGNCASGAGPACNDTVTRNITWVGNIGLLYPSDYFFATDGGEYGREYCLGLLPSGSGFGVVGQCTDNIWILVNNEDSWSMTPSYPTSSYGAGRSIVMKIYRGIMGQSASTIYSVLPTVYLKSNVKIVSGEGTESSPFVAALEE